MSTKGKFSANEPLPNDVLITCMGMAMPTWTFHVRVRRLAKGFSVWSLDEQALTDPDRYRSVHRSFRRLTVRNVFQTIAQLRNLKIGNEFWTSVEIVGVTGIGNDLIRLAVIEDWDCPGYYSRIGAFLLALSSEDLDELIPENRLLPPHETDPQIALDGAPIEQINQFIDLAEHLGLAANHYRLFRKTLFGKGYRSRFQMLNKLHQMKYDRFIATAALAQSAGSNEISSTVALTAAEYWHDFMQRPFSGNLLQRIGLMSTWLEALNGRWYGIDHWKVARWLLSQCKAEEQEDCEYSDDSAYALLEELRLIAPQVVSEFVDAIWVVGLEENMRAQRLKSDVSLNSQRQRSESLSNFDFAQTLKGIFDRVNGR
jgi:hypothetical protein